MSPQRLRAYVRVGVRDALIPGLGAVTTVYLLLSGGLEPWHLPVLGGMMGVPLVARGGDGEEPDERRKLPPSPDEEE